MNESNHTRVPVSVIIPVYNHTDGVVNAIRSVLDQTHLPTELIVVDDHSDIPLSDTAAEVLQEAAQHMSVILKRHEENAGAAAARNTGIEAATSDFLAFLDADDVWTPRKLELQHPALTDAITSKSVPIALVTGFDLPGSYVVGNQKPRRDLIPRGASTLLEFASGCWYCPGSTLMVHRTFFDQIGRYDRDLRRFEDYELFLRAARQECELIVSPSTLATINSTPDRARPSPDASLKRIEEKNRPWMEATDPLAVKRMLAYFALEQAASHLRQRNYVSGARALARSMWHHPRRSRHVIDRWITS